MSTPVSNVELDGSAPLLPKLSIKVIFSHFNLSPYFKHSQRALKMLKRFINEHKSLATMRPAERQRCVRMPTPYKTPA